MDYARGRELARRLPLPIMVIWEDPALRHERYTKRKEALRKIDAVNRDSLHLINVISSY